MTGIDKARETARKIKSEVEGEQQESALATVQANAELAQLFKDNADLGSANISGELPLLKVHATGRSSSNELLDGSEPKDGNFFYKPTHEEFENVTCHILTISRGFRALGLQQNGEQKEVFNQIVGGVIIDENKELKPFLLYVTGLKLANLWKFGKEISKYTKAKPVPIPILALTVKLTTEKVKNTFGMSWIINFEVLKDEEGSVQVVTDTGLFQFLKDHVYTLEETIENIIKTKALPEPEVDAIPTEEDERIKMFQEALPVSANPVTQEGEDTIPF